MSLNIKNPRTHELVRELAELTGQSQTSAVEDAVRRRLAELARDREHPVDAERLSRILDIGRRFAARMPVEFATVDDPTQSLYDEAGLPR